MKQEIKIGKRNNQNLVSIPHAQFAFLLTYKAELFGIKVEEKEEGYTSKCSFLDFEPISQSKGKTGNSLRRNFGERYLNAKRMYVNEKGRI